MNFAIILRDTGLVCTILQKFDNLQRISDCRTAIQAQVRVWHELDIWGYS
jgi:hypothetical protein